MLHWIPVYILFKMLCTQHVKTAIKRITELLHCPINRMPLPHWVPCTIKSFMLHHRYPSIWGPQMNLGQKSQVNFCATAVWISLSGSGERCVNFLRSKQELDKRQLNTYKRERFDVELLKSRCFSAYTSYVVKSRLVDHQLIFLLISLLSISPNCYRVSVC